MPAQCRDKRREAGAAQRDVGLAKLPRHAFDDGHGVMAYAVNRKVNEVGLRDLRGEQAAAVIYASIVV